MSQFNNQCEFKEFYCTTTFWNEEWGQNGPKTCPKIQNKPKCLQGDWVPIGTWGVLIDT